MWWRLSLSLALSLALAVLLATLESSASMDSWTEVNSHEYYWEGVASSGNGQYLLGATDSNGVFLSSNNGSSWTVASKVFLKSSTGAVAISSTGEYMMAGECTGYIYYSQTYGSSWSEGGGSLSACWSAISTQASGEVAVACTDNYIYISSNYGASWTASPTAPTVYYTNIAIAAASSYVLACAETTGLYVSSNLGATWSLNVAEAYYWRSVAVSSTGQYMYAVAEYNYLYTSSNFGATFATSTAVGALEWMDITCSSTGQVVALAAYASPIALSEDYGKTWYNSNSYSYSWISIASDSSGSQILAAAVDTGLFIGTLNSTTLSPTLTPSVGPTAQPISAAPSQIPTLAPSPLPSMVPTLSPSALPTIAPSFVPSVHPSMTPTMMPSAQPTLNPTAVPSQQPSPAPSAVPSLAPSPIPTAVPSLAPTEAPSSMPSSAPSSPPSSTPSSFPSPAPTLSLKPTVDHSPTVAPTFPPSYLLFDANITLNNVASNVLDSDSQSALIATTASCLGLQNQAVQYVGQGPVPMSALPAHIVSAHSITYSMVAVMQVSVASSSAAQAGGAFNSYSTELQTEVNNGAFTSILNSQSVIYSATATVAANATQVSYSNATFVDTRPTMQPTSAPDTGDGHNGDARKAAFLVQLAEGFPGVLIAVAVINVLSLRANYREALSEINSLLSEVADGVLKGLMAYLSLSLMVSYADAAPASGAFVAFALLLVARVLLVCLWSVVVALILQPTSGRVPQGGQPSADDVDLEARGRSKSSSAGSDARSGPRLLLALLLHKEALKSKLEVTGYSLLVSVSVIDLSLLRLLPWTRTDLTHTMQGYPSLLMMRCCMYGSFVSHLIQALAMVVHIAFDSPNETSKAQAQKTFMLLAFTMFNVFRSFITVLMSVQMVNTQKANLVVVNEDDLSAIAGLASTSRSRSSRVSSGVPDGGSRKMLTPDAIRELVKLSRRSDGPTVAVDLSDAEPGPSPIPHEICIGGSYEGEDKHGTENESVDADGVEQMDGRRRGSSGDISAITEPTLQMLDDDDAGEVDDRGIRFSTSVPFAEQTVEVLKFQLVKAGKVPAQFLPLDQIQAEIGSVFAFANQGLPYDEARLDYLLMCLELNPDYRLQKERETRRWREENDAFLRESLQTMRAYVPPQVFTASMQALTEQDGLDAAIAKRLLAKKCLWLVRLSAHDISRLHIAELTGRFNPEAQGLDMVEAAAIYACLPVAFPLDAEGRKERFRASMEQQVRDLLTQAQKGTLAPMRRRNPVYRRQGPLFDERESLFVMETAKSSEAPRDSFRSLGSALATQAQETASSEEASVGSESAVQRGRNMLLKGSGGGVGQRNARKIDSSSKDSSDSVQSNERIPAPEPRASFQHIRPPAAGLKDMIASAITRRLSSSAHARCSAASASESIHNPVLQNHLNATANDDL